MKKGADIIKVGNRTIEVSLNLVLYKEGDSFIAFSPALDLYAFGDTQQEAFDAFDETAKIYLEHVVQHKTLDKDLKRLGWKKHHHFKKRHYPPSYDTNEIMADKGINQFSVTLGRELALQQAH